MTAHKISQGGFFLFQHRWDWIAMSIPYFSEYSAKNFCIFMNLFHFYHILETIYYLINSRVYRNRTRKKQQTYANAILVKELKKDVQQGVYLMILVRSSSYSVQQ